MKLINDFKQFLLRGNVVDLAVGVVIGVAFGAVVTSLVENIITPLIGAIGGQPDFSGLSFTINKSPFMYGKFLNSLISFIIVSAVIFFFVVKPMNMLLNRMKKSDKVADPTSKKCPECLGEIPLEAKKCMYCTSVIK